MNEVSSIIISILQMGKLRFGEIKYLPSAKQLGSGEAQVVWPKPTLCTSPLHGLVT